MKFTPTRNRYIIISLVIFFAIWFVFVYWNRATFENLSTLNRNTAQSQLSTIVDINTSTPGQLIGCSGDNAKQINAVYTALFPAISAMNNTTSQATDCATQQTTLQNMYDNLDLYQSSLNDVFTL